MAPKSIFRLPFRRFARDERGAFAIMFGVMAIVLVALGGAVVDYVTLEQGRNRAQLALDAAALALQPSVFESDFSADQVQTLAQAFVNERVGNNSVQITTTTGNPEEGSLYFRARITVPTIFVALVGVHELNANMESEATRKKLALEVVMVLDNSGSMKDHNRMDYLKLAARCATNTLFYDAVVDDAANSNTCVPAPDAALVENVKIGVVPFTMYVNVGPSNKNSGWIDVNARSPIHDDNFDNDDNQATLPTTLPTRFQLFDALGEDWRGCVEARPHIKSGTLPTEYLDTDDTDVTTGATYFVPLFSPDMVDSIGGNNYVADSPQVCDRPAENGTKCTVRKRRTGCNASMSNSSCTTTILQAEPSGGSVNFTSTSRYPHGTYGARPSTCDCRNAPTNWTQTGGSNNNRTFELSYSCSNVGYIPTGLSDRVLQERICKYWGGFSASSNFSRGPNAECTRTAILPLTSTPATVITTIDSMVAEGGTNIHEGTAWGFRALSPTAPFTEGAPYDEATSKVMIVMTDGENTAYNLSNYCGSAMRNLDGSCYNSAYGFPYNSKNTSTTSSSGGNVERLGQLGTSNADLVTAMNERTAQSCTNAKAAGIKIYTIGLSTDKSEQSTPEVVRAMLRACASAPDMAYFPDRPSELKAVFASIANELSALRLVR